MLPRPPALYLEYFWTAEPHNTTDRLLSYHQGGKLEIQIYQARGLAAKDRTLFGRASSDPYVIVKVGALQPFVHEGRTSLTPISLFPPFKFC